MCVGGGGGLAPHPSTGWLCPATSVHTSSMNQGRADFCLQGLSVSDWAGCTLQEQPQFQQRRASPGDTARSTQTSLRHLGTWAQTVRRRPQAQRQPATPAAGQVGRLRWVLDEVSGTWWRWTSARRRPESWELGMSLGHPLPEQDPSSRGTKDTAFPPSCPSCAACVHRSLFSHVPAMLWEWDVDVVALGWGPHPSHAVEVLGCLVRLYAQSKIQRRARGTRHTEIRLSK